LLLSRQVNLYAPALWQKYNLLTTIPPKLPSVAFEHFFRPGSRALYSADWATAYVSVVLLESALGH
jgi:hypothetical protein